MREAMQLSDLEGAPSRILTLSVTRSLHVDGSPHVLPFACPLQPFQQKIGEFPAARLLPCLMVCGIDNGVELKIDKAGRIVVPKRLRERVGFRPDTELVAVEQPDGVLLKRVEQRPSMVKVDGLWVHQGHRSRGRTGARPWGRSRGADCVRCESVARWKFSSIRQFSLPPPSKAIPTTRKPGLRCCASPQARTRDYGEHRSRKCLPH